MWSLFRNKRCCAQQNVSAKRLKICYILCILEIKFFLVVFHFIQFYIFPDIDQGPQESFVGCKTLIDGECDYILEIKYGYLFFSDQDPNQPIPTNSKLLISKFLHNKQGWTMLNISFSAIIIWLEWQCSDSRFKFSNCYKIIPNWFLDQYTWWLVFYNT